MKHIHVPAAAVTALLAAIAFTPGAAHADYKCARPNGSIEQRACAMAAAGPDALRRFVERTRSIYGLYYWDYVRVDPERAAVAGAQVLRANGSVPSTTSTRPVSTA